MTEFQAIFHRYSSKSGESRFSAPVFIRAEDFRDALDRAELMVAGMRAMSPEGRSELKIIVAELSHRGIRGEHASPMGRTIWETEDELSARIRGETEAEA